MSYNDNTQTLEVSTLATYAVDQAHSTVQFKVRHLGFSKVTGRFKEFEASFNLDPEDLNTLEAEATIRAASVTTSDDKRDQHLRSADFFDVERFPELTFKSSGVQDVKGNTLKLAGDLTIHGVTKAVVLDVEFMGEASDPWGGERAAFEARTRINRTDFGLTWNSVLETGGLLVAEEVEILLEIQGVKQ